MRAVADKLHVVLNPEQRDRVERLPIAREQIAHSRVLNIDFFPKESHLVTFRDPHSFPMLFHPACNQLVRKHMDILAQKVGWNSWYISNSLTYSHQDSFCMCLFRRISYYTILPTKEPNS